MSSHADSGAPSFTNSIDGCIIKGFLDNRRAMFKKLTTMGFSRNAIIDRARELGLSDQFIKKCSVGHHDVAMRTCLGCNERFLSMGVENRLCPRCRNRR
jgi:Fe2+ transport system protein FeoA